MEPPQRRWLLDGRIHLHLGFHRYLSLFPGAVYGVDYVEPFNEETFEDRVGDAVLYWFSRLHFGRFYGMTSKILWAAIGLVPVAMFVTGVLMWWNRVIKPARS